MKFQFTATDTGGKKVSGEIEAASKISAADQLFQTQKLNVITIDSIDGQAESTAEGSASSEQKTDSAIEKMIEENSNLSEKLVEEKSLYQKINDWLIQKSPVSIADKSIFFRLFAVMNKAGVPVRKSLKVLSDQTNNLHLKQILSVVEQKVQSGQKIANSLSDYPSVFTEAEIGSVEAGESSGKLDETLNYLAINAEKNLSLKNKIHSAMVYPVIVLLILAASIFLIMIFVIPKIAELFTGTGAELPLATKIFINTSNWFIRLSPFGLPNWMILLAFIFGAVVFIRFWKKTENGKLIWDELMIKLPIFGELQMKASVATLARQMQMLTMAGVPIVRSLEIAAHAIENSIYRRAVLTVRDKVVHGSSLNEAMNTDSLFPKMLVSMFAIGEQTAQLGSVAERVAIFYDEEIDTFTENLTTIIKPLIIVILGVFIVGLVMAIIGPIMQLTDLASQA